MAVVGTGDAMDVDDLTHGSEDVFTIVFPKTGEFRKASRRVVEMSGVFGELLKVCPDTNEPIPVYDVDVQWFDRAMEFNEHHKTDLPVPLVTENDHKAYCAQPIEPFDAEFTSFVGDDGRFDLDDRLMKLYEMMHVANTLDMRLLLFCCMRAIALAIKDHNPDTMMVALGMDENHLFTQAEVDEIKAEYPDFANVMMPPAAMVGSGVPFAPPPN